MTMFTEDGELKIWVPRRSAHLKSYPGMLDTTVDGGVKVEESPFECIIHKADEEASLPEDLIRERVRACGVLTYAARSGAGSGGEQSLIVPDIIYVYDLEVGEDVVPKPRDEEVKDFYLWDVERIKEALGRGEFKPNCVVVMVDFLIRHGVITEENEGIYLNIVQRLHRRLPVDTSAWDQTSAE